jgi:hypothetical protein
MSIIDWFRPSYRVVAQQGCAGCSARMAHIEDLQNLLKSEREGNSLLQTILFQRSGYQVPVPSEQSTEALKPLRQFQTLSQRRRVAEQREREEHPDAQKEYWTKVQSEYDKAGKLPKPEESVS